MDVRLSSRLTPRLPFWLRFRLRRLVDRGVDRWLGIDSWEQVDSDTLGFARPEYVHYDPTSWLGLLLVNHMLRQLPISEQDTFIDFGSGKGRMLVLAARHPFGRVIGVELTESLNYVARRNIARCRHRLRCQEIEVVTADASHYILPDDVTMAYFNNPFTGAVFAAVIDAIEASLARRPRALRLIYTEPHMHDYLVTRGFHPVRRLHRITLYVAASRGASLPATYTEQTNPGSCAVLE